MSAYYMLGTILSASFALSKYLLAWEVILHPPFYSCGNGGPERFSNLPKVPQLVGGGVRI